MIKGTERAEEPLRIAANLLASKYQTAVGRVPEASRANTLILDAMMPKMPDDLEASLDQLLRKHPHIGGKVANRADDQALYRQPAILLVYLMADEHPHVTQEVWPLTMYELEPIYSDIGRSLS